MSSEGKFFTVVAIIAALAIGAIIIFSKNNQKIIDVSGGDSYKIGPDDAKVKIIAFEDFQCPACKAAEPAIRQVIKEYSTTVQFVFRHFPLPFHPNAEEAALAAEAAGAQGKFWEMKELLYDTQESWSALSNPDNYFGDLAKELGLDLDKFKNSYRSSELKQKIKADIEAAKAAQVNQTPTFFVNGKKVIGAQSLESWKKLIEEASSQPTP
jgi:protein-disulfide isomerase